MKVRIKFTKVGALRYVGHLDFMRTFQKIIKRSGVLAVFTRGFSPHMIMSFASPLGVGLESLGEYVDFEMAYRDPYELTKIELQRMSQLNIENDELPDVPPEAVIINMLNSECPDGVRILSVKRIEEAKGKAMALVSASDNVVFFENDWLHAAGILPDRTHCVLLRDPDVQEGFFHILPAASRTGKSYILNSIQILQQTVLLKDKGDLFGRKAGDLSFIRFFKTGQQTEEGRFSCPGRPHNGIHAPFFKRS